MLRAQGWSAALKCPQLPLVRGARAVGAAQHQAQPAAPAATDDTGPSHPSADARGTALGMQAVRACSARDRTGRGWRGSHSARRTIVYSKAQSTRRRQTSNEATPRRSANAADDESTRARPPILFGADHVVFGAQCASMSASTLSGREWFGRRQLLHEMPPRTPTHRAVTPNRGRAWKVIAVVGKAADVAARNAPASTWASKLLVGGCG